MKYFFNRKQDYLYGFILFCFASIILLTCGQSFFKEYTPEEKEEIKQEILSQIDDTTLCEELYGETLSRCGEIYDKNFEEKFYNLNEYQREFFVAQGLNQYMSEGGVGLYLVESRGLFITDLANTLDKFELSEFSDLWRNFMDRPDIDWDALIKEVREYDDWDETELLESIYGKYPLKEFDDAFFELNQDNLYTKKLDEYARAHIDQYDYGRISERHLIR